MATDTIQDPAVDEPEPTQDDGPAPSPDRPHDPDPPADPAPSTERMKWLEEQIGYRLSERYSSDEAMAEGIKNALELIGQRDEDAQFGRSLRRTLAPDQIERLLRGEIEPQKPASDSSPDSTPDMPASYREYQLLLEKLKQSNDPTDPEYRRALAAATAFSRRNFEAVRELDNLKKDLASIKDKLASQEQTFQARTEEQAVDQWLGSHAGEFWQDPAARKKPTALAEQVAHQYEHNPVCKKLPPQGVDRWEHAYAAAHLALRPIQKTNKPGAGAINQPATRKKVEPVTYEGLIKQGLSPAEALEKLSDYYRSLEG